jgi:5'-nucleotidase (lipoprotein e(P4) family)
MRTLLVLPFAFLPLVSACTQDPDVGDDGAADIQGEDVKADTGPGIEVTARIVPGSVDAVLTTAVPRLGYVFYAGENSKLTLEVTHAGSQNGLDTLLKVYGPRLADGTYPKTIASDDDDGYGKLSRIKDLEISIPGFYLVELTSGPNAAPVTTARARLKLACDGTCESVLPIQPIDEGLKWYRRSAERRAATLQAYGLATSVLNQKVADGVPAQWGVILDADETILNNSAYQQARLDLGVGFSPGSWTAWVNQKAATAIDGTAAFTHEVQALGGRVVIVTNRKAVIECPQTEANLQAVGVVYDAILCQTDVSDKNPRFAAVAAGTAVAGMPALSVVMFVGDNIQDFPHLTQDIRTQDASAFAAFGDSYILVPNPMYGSFDKNPS